MRKRSYILPVIQLIWISTMVYLVVASTYNVIEAKRGAKRIKQTEKKLQEVIDKRRRLGLLK